MLVNLHANRPSMLYTHPSPRVSIISGENTFPGIRAHILVNDGLEGSFEFDERVELSVGIHGVYSEHVTFPEDCDILIRGHFVHPIYPIHGLSVSVEKPAVHICTLWSTAEDSSFHVTGLEIALEFKGRQRNDGRPLSLAMRKLAEGIRASHATPGRQWIIAPRIDLLVRRLEQPVVDGGILEALHQSSVEFAA